MKILTINKTRLRHASHIKIMERFLTRLAKLTIEHEAHTEYRKAFTDAFDKESGLYRQQTSSEYTAKIQDADVRRDRAWINIVRVAQSMAVVGNEDQRKTAQRLIDINTLYKVNTAAQMDQESGVLDNVIHDIDLASLDMASLGLATAYGELKNANALVDELLDLRDNERAGYQVGQMKAARAATDAAYDATIDYINALLLLQPTEALTNFAEEWNSVLNRVRVQILGYTSNATQVDVEIPDTPSTDDNGGGVPTTPPSSEGEGGASGDGSTPDTGGASGGGSTGTEEPPRED